MIADKLCKDVGPWTVIDRSNMNLVPSSDSIRVGLTYRLPCIDGLPVGLLGGPPSAPGKAVAAAASKTPDSAEQVSQERAAWTRAREGQSVRLLAADVFKPFAIRLQMSSGLFTDLLDRALVGTDEMPSHQFYWVNDRSVHLDPMHGEGMVALAFP